MSAGTSTLGWVQALKPGGLVEEHGVERVRPLKEGHGHTGDGAVVRYAGRRPTV